MRPILCNTKSVASAPIRLKNSHDRGSSFPGIKVLILTLFATFVSFNGYAQLSGCNCTSNDVTNISAFLSSDADGTPLTNSECEAGETYSAFLSFRFQLNASQRPGIWMQVTYSLNDGPSQSIEHCFPELFEQPIDTLSIALTGYECGDKVTVESAILAWGTGNGTGAAQAFCEEGIFLKCKDITPHCKITSQPMVAEAPLIGNVSVDKSCTGIEIGTAQSITLTGSATGGVEAYVFDWDIDGDGIYETPNQQVINPSLAIGSHTVTMRVTDAANPAATDTHEITVQVTACAPLPVTYSYIKAYASREGETQIEWQTTLETNFDHFEVEKSKDGRRFTAFGPRITQPATISKQFKTYRASDTSPFNGVTYYRLKQVDTDGTLNYSKIIVASHDNPAKRILLSPNPVRDVLKVELGAAESGQYTIEIFDATGTKQWATEGVNHSAEFQHQVDTKHLSPGIYFVTLKIQDQFYFNKLVK